MKDLNIEIFKELSPYFTLVHHSNGRIRLRVSKDIKNHIKDTKLDNLDEKILSINGIKSIKFNKLIGSVTIEYDSDTLPAEFWNELINGKNYEKALDIIKDIL